MDQPGHPEHWLTASDWRLAIRAIVFSVAAVLAIEIALPLLLELASAPYH